jgi:rod shape-determining protein MreC
MQNLIAFLTKKFHWLLFFFLELVSMLLLFRYNSYQGSVWITSANAVSGKVYDWKASVTHFFSLQEREQMLTTRNIELSYQLRLARQELLEMKGDTATVDSMLNSVICDLHLLPAKVVDNTLNRPDNLITIDKGSADGIRPEMGVVCGMGLVGVVFMTGTHYSVVMPVLNTKSRISCSIRGRDYFGYLLWDGKDPTVAFVEDVPRHAQLRKGEWIETSGYSDIFPPGITVGQIESVFNSPDGMSYRLKVKLTTDFGRLRDVRVITDDIFSERMQLMKAARDSLSVKNQ